MRVTGVVRVSVWHQTEATRALCLQSTLICTAIAKYYGCCQRFDGTRTCSSALLVKQGLHGAQAQLDELRLPQPFSELQRGERPEVASTPLYPCASDACVMGGSRAC